MDAVEKEHCCARLRLVVLEMVWEIMHFEHGESGKRRNFEGL